MKAAYTLIFTLLLLVGCGESNEKDPQPDENIEEQLSGSWTKSLIRLQYFDASGAMDFEDRVTDENGIVYTFKSGKLNTVDPDGTAYEVNYKVIERDGENYVQLSDGTHSVDNRILELTDSTLIWENDYEYLEYHESGTRKTADKALYIEEFMR